MRTLTTRRERGKPKGSRRHDLWSITDVERFAQLLRAAIQHAIEGAAGGGGAARLAHDMGISKGRLSELAQGKQSEISGANYSSVDMIVRIGAHAQFAPHAGISDPREALLVRAFQATVSPPRRAPLRERADKARNWAIVRTMAKDKRLRRLDEAIGLAAVEFLRRLPRHRRHADEWEVAMTELDTPPAIAAPNLVARLGALCGNWPLGEPVLVSRQLYYVVRSELPLYLRIGETLPPDGEEIMVKRADEDEEDDFVLWTDYITPRYKPLGRPSRVLPVDGATKRAKARQHTTR